MKLPKQQQQQQLQSFFSSAIQFQLTTNVDPSVSKEAARLISQALTAQTALTLSLNCLS